MLCAGCSEKEKLVVHDTTSMSADDCKAMAAAIQAQYATIMSSHNPQASLILDLSDNSANLVINIQNNTIVMAQLTLRNPYPNSPDMAPTPYTDIHGDGVLETYPANTRTLPQSSLTYANYLALLTRFGIPKEVKKEEIPSQTPISKNRKTNPAQDIMPPPSPLDVLNRIAQ